ncbi:arylamine N-acetyltransferase [Oikeobacillus pervagus]|uniref:Arylamine N-acetyltransferase n=1 Tax=Oikeobacillus pervagus TaxID=1325931 RepID=A0AAJ1T722_9BACI|nr:arylamine N-acetyltransferase [Oikeobacillus pervagus]MDQ0215795.1 arylamine N-acetyltransferase [Oikeobacillus pervagus]
MDSVYQYLQLLKLEKEIPSLNYLQRILQHHLLRIPYETFSKFHYFEHLSKGVPSFDSFVSNFAQKGWGGTCFTLNISFARLLRFLGFVCHYIRVHPGHLALMVVIEGRQYYVDVGYGSPIMKPVELAHKPKHVLHGFGEEIIFTHKKDYIFIIDRRSNGKSFVKKEIEWIPLDEEGLKKDIQASYKDEDENITMRRMTAVRFQGNSCYYLRNNVLKVMTYRNIREYHMRYQNQWLRMVNDVFQIDQASLENSIHFLEDRGVFLFEDV